jgi:flavin reductase (DIM6/NTAB) family NADH-FMN oxidoreductase RutF
MVRARAAITIDRTKFAHAMRQLPSGVVMVTVRVDGRPWGLTVSSCTSLSADPPQILISLGSKTVTCKEILAGERFGVSILGAEHREVAAFGSAAGAAKFVDDYCTGSECEGVETPRVREALYHLDCSLVAAHQHADHHVIVGAVEQAIAGDGAHRNPLAYLDGTYRRIGDRLA